MTRAKDISKIVTDANLSGTLDVTGAFTSQGIDDNANATAITIDSSENVGIGTSSPTFSAGGGVHNKGTSGAFTSYRVSVDSNTGVDFSQGSDGKGYIYNRDNADLIIATNNTERMRINSAGSVSIGTSSSPNNAPLLIKCATDDNIRISQQTHASIQAVNDAASAFTELKLDGSTLLLNSQSGGNVGIGTSTALSGSSAVTALRIGNQINIYEYDDGSNPVQMNINQNIDASENYIVTDQASRYQMRNGVHKWFSVASGTAGTASGIGSGEKMQLDASGNLGINETSPDKKVHITEGDGDVLRLERSGAFSGTWDVKIGSQATGDFSVVDAVGSTTPFHIDKGSPTTSFRIFSNGSKTFGAHTSGSSGFNIFAGAANTGAFAARFEGVGTGSSNVVQFTNGFGEVGKITLSGASTAYVTSSDHRLKENVTADWDATTRLKQLNPVRFNFIADADDTTVDGFLAHEVQSVVPEAVTGTHNEVQVWKDGEELPDGVSVGDNKLDEDGNTIPVYQGIDQSKLVPLLVKTIQELEARIVALETA